MIYEGTCKDRDNNNIRVMIATLNGSGTRQITILEDGVTITYDSDSIFKPLMKSGATIEILTEYLVEDFYTGTLGDPKVYIYRNNELIWFGYVTPTVFTQPFVNERETLTLNCIDALANLEYVDYSIYQDATHINTFLDTIRYCVLKNTNTPIKSIYYTNTLSVNNNTRILQELGCVERNFTDEIEDVMKCDEVIEEICKFLGLCMFQYKDAYYIVDYNNLSVNYWRSDLGVNSAINELSYFPTINISDIGVGADDASITLDGVYNKITVIANTLSSSNPIESSSDSGSDSAAMGLFADLVANNYFNGDYETKDIWVNKNVDRNNSDLFGLGAAADNFYEATEPRKNNVWDTEEHDGWTHYKLLCSWFKLNPNVWEYQPFIQYVTGEPTQNTAQLADYSETVDFDFMTDYYSATRGAAGNDNRWGASYVWSSYGGNTGLKTWGLMVQKTFAYEAENVPSEYQWKTYLTIPCTKANQQFKDYFLRTTRQLAPMMNGYLTINFNFYMSYNNTIAVPNTIPEWNKTYDDTISNNLGKQKERKVVWPAKLSIGNRYWDGDNWQTYSENFLRKIAAGYFSFDLGDHYVSESSGAYTSCQPNDTNAYNTYAAVYKTWNSTYNDWDYVTKSEYDAFSGNKTKIDSTIYRDKDSQGNYYGNAPWYFYFPDNRGYYIRRADGTIVMVDEDYQKQWVSDRFWLTFRAKNGDQVYGSEHSLINTSSYNLHLTESAEGYSIKLPDDETLTGDFKFQISYPTRHFEALYPGATIGKNITDGYMHISDLYIKYSASDESQNVFEKKSNNNDITYTNVINSGYVQELDDVQLKINTYNPTIKSYSYVLDSNSNYVENVTYNGSSKKMEQHLIDKYVAHFSTPKFKYCGTLHNTDSIIKPCSIIHQSQLNKNLAIYKTTYHVLSNTVEVESVEV